MDHMVRRVLLSILPLFALGNASDFLTIRQLNADGNASFSLLSTKDGSVIATSDLSFSYQRPLIEATATDSSYYYVVSFPEDDPNNSAHLWKLDSNLDVEKEWVQPAGGLAFFDLQYSSLQQELFGIAVEGTYGRVISRLDISGDEVSAEYIVACPYMWYVNSSSFDHKNDIYFGLLNKFDDESAGQKLMIVNVVSGNSFIYDYDPSETGLLYYITYSSEQHDLFAMAAEQNTGAAQIGSLTYPNDDDNNTDDDGERQLSIEMKNNQQQDRQMSDKLHRISDTFATFESFLTFDSAIGKYSPSFMAPNGDLCSLLGNAQYSPQLECYSPNEGQLTTPVDISPLHQGNAAAVAGWA